MKLYTNKQGQWFGTKAEAKASRHPYWDVDVPTDKPSLLTWLNAQSAPQAQTEAPVHQSKLTRPHHWQTIKECAEKASLKDLGVALAVAMNRMDEIADRYKQS